MAAAPFEIAVDGAIIRGEAAGFGLPVVFLHAGVTDRRMWRSQMEQFESEGYHVIAYDRRGFGETEAPDEPFSHLVDLETVLDQLSVHAAVFVGCSMGGALAIDFALDHPERVVALVLVGTAISGAPEYDYPPEYDAILDAYSYAEERQNITQLNRIEAHAWLDGPLEESGRVEGEARELFLEMNGNAHSKPKLTQEELPEPAYDNLDQVKAPALLIVGDLDFPDVIEMHQELDDQLPEAFSVLMEGVAHLPPLERPDLFNPFLAEFLEAITGVGEVGEGEEDGED